VSPDLEDPRTVCEPVATAGKARPGSGDLAPSVRGTPRVAPPPAVPTRSEAWDPRKPTGALKPPWVSKGPEPSAGAALGHRPEAYLDPPGELGAPRRECCRSWFGTLPTEVRVHPVEGAAGGSWDETKMIITQRKKITNDTTTTTTMTEEDEERRYDDRSYYRYDRRYKRQEEATERESADDDEREEEDEEEPLLDARTLVENSLHPTAIRAEYTSGSDVVVSDDVDSLMVLCSWSRSAASKWRT